MITPGNPALWSEADWQQGIQLLGYDPRASVGFVEAARRVEEVLIGDAPRGDEPGYIYVGTGLMVNDRVSDRVGQLATLPINGGSGPVLLPAPTTMTGPPLLPSGGFGGGAPAGGIGGIIKGIAGQLAQGAVNWGTEKAGDWITNQFGQGTPGQGGPVARTGGGGVPQTMGGQGGINLPMGGQQGAGGVIYVPGKGLVWRQSFTGTFTRDRKVRFDAMGNIVMKAKRMNVLNPHALSRAFRRTQGFAHVAKAALSMFGLHVTGHPRLKSGKKKHRFGRR